MKKTVIAIAAFTLLVSACDNKEKEFDATGIFEATEVTVCNVLELVDNFGFLISFFFDKFIC